MSGADNVPCFQLQVRHRVGSWTVIEKQISVEFVRLDPYCLSPNKDVPDPHRVGLRARERALEDDVAHAVRLVMVDEDAKLLELLIRCEERAQQFC